MSKSEQTRQLIIEKAASSFNIKGYENTSLSDVQNATGLTKGAIYGHFTDKNELAVEAYEYISSRINSRLRSEMDAQTSARGALTAFTDFYLQNWNFLFRNGGCPIQNAAVEADDHLEFLKNSVRNSIRQIIKDLQLVIKKGQDNKEFSKEVSPEQYAAMFFSIIEGGILLAKAMNDPKYLKLAVDRVNLIIEQELMK
jgi:AcrR family transcriptional regulator